MIHATNLSYAYSKQEELFTRLNLTLQSGSISGLLGKNGAGKTTLLKLLAGLLRQQSGDLKIGDFSPSQRLPGFLSDIYMVQEEFTIPSVRIKTFVNAAAPLYPNFDREKFQKITGEFEIDQQKKLNKMSHGQRKKFLIAFALSTNCKVLLLDEPTNGLDIPSKSLFRKVLVSSITDEQLVIISTHQVKDVENILDHLVLIDDGDLLFQGDTWRISEKYRFQKLDSVNNNENIVYHEKAPGGYKAMLESDDKNETGIDIELFFNAVVNNSQIKL